MARKPGLGENTHHAPLVILHGNATQVLPIHQGAGQLDHVLGVYGKEVARHDLASEMGLAVGISSGANLLGALTLAADLDPGAAVATVFAECNKKYLSTDLCGDERVLDHYLAPRVKLLGVRVLSRV